MKKIIFSLLITATTILSAGAATIWVDMVNDQFHAKYLYVPIGTTVVWTNYGTHTHTVTSNTMVFNSGDLITGNSFSYTFNTLGDFGYFCMHHPMMTGVVYVRNSANLTVLLNMNPVNPPIVIPPGGGSFSYAVSGTNQTPQPLPTTYWTKIYPPNNALPFQTFQKGVSLPPSGTRGATLGQSVSGTAFPGLYNFVGYVGNNPDSVLAWNSFTFTKSSSTLDGTGWESVIIEDWHDVGSSSNNDQTTIDRSISLRNSPEPFNPSTTITFVLPAAGEASLEVFNLSGALVATLANGYQSAGEHQVTFDASSLASGIYVYRLSLVGQSISNKMRMVK
jgi:plastocyanin